MICPRCGHDNIEGMDRCANCIEPLRDRDVPQPTAGLQRLLMEEPVSALGSTAVTVSPEATVSEAIRRMRENRTGCVLVAANGLLVGIFTERDLLLSIVGAGKDLNALLVRDCMTRAPETVEATDSLRVALNKMSVGGFRHIPIVDAGRITGIVTAKDAVRFLAREVMA